MFIVEFPVRQSALLVRESHTLEFYRYISTWLPTITEFLVLYTSYFVGIYRLGSVMIRY